MFAFRRARALAWLAGLSILCGEPAFAAGDLLVAPTRVILDGARGGIRAVGRPDAVDLSGDDPRIEHVRARSRVESP